MDSFETVARHYSALSQHYDDWFSSPWPAPAIRQGEALDTLLPPRSRVLDLTCGVGTQSFGLALKGHEVTGVDISHGQIEEARRRSQSSAIRWLVGNAAEIAHVVTGSFDAIISFGNSFPLLGDAETMARSLRQCHGLLVPGGTVMVSMRDHADLRARKPQEIGRGPTTRGEWIETAEWLPDGMRYKSHITFTTMAQECIDYDFPPLAAVTGAEMLQMLRDVGFAGVEVFSNPAFSFPVFKGVK